MCAVPLMPNVVLMSKRGLLVLPVMGVATALVVTGCGFVQAQSLISDDGTVQDKIATVVIEGDAGDIQVKVGSVPAATVHRNVHYSNTKPGSTFESNAGTLTLKGCGPRPPGDSCYVDYEVVLPAAAVVRGHNGSGDSTFDHMTSVDYQSGSGSLTASNVSGDLKATLGSGSLDLADIGGKVTADVGSGRIHGVRLSGASTTVKTGSGGVDLGTTNQQDVRMETGSGSATLTVPSGSYRLDVRSSSGHKEVAVQEDASAAHTLYVHSGSGHVKINAA